MTPLQRSLARLQVYWRRYERKVRSIWELVEAERKKIDQAAVYKRHHNKGRNGRLNKPWER